MRVSSFLDRYFRANARRVGRLDDLKARKRELRRLMVERVLAMAPEQRRAEQAALVDRFVTLPGLDRASTVLLYASHFPEEIDTAPMLRLLLEQGRRLVCPRVDRAGRRLRLHLIEDPADDFAPGALGIPEPIADRPEIGPEQVDWVLVPGLAFDARGFRLGRGAGHYDRLLPLLRPEVPRWALGFTPQRLETLPTEPHDEPIDGYADADEVRTFRRRFGDGLSVR
ncbi:5-formyltetrahydrofolate cyclo-ligase [soil metagenome]